MTRVKRRGKPNKRAWRKAKRTRTKRCPYCWGPFSHDNPPTFDHIDPLSRNHLSSKTVLACRLCNNLRGNADHASYEKAVAEERAAATAERRPYRRPRLVGREGEKYLTTTTRAERAANQQQEATA